MLRILVPAILILNAGLCFSQSISFEEVRKQKPLKRGKEYQIYWKGGSSDEIVTVQLRKQDVVIKEWPSILNAGKCLVFLPSNLKPGVYSFAIINSSTQDLIQSDQTKIKRRIPLFLKLGIPLLITTIIAIDIRNQNGVGVSEATMP